MNSLYLLIPIALVLIVFALVVLYWAINNGQYDDLDTESKRILFDSDKPSETARPKGIDSQKVNTEKTGKEGS